MPSIEVEPPFKVVLTPVEAQTFDITVSAPNPLVQVFSEGPQGPAAPALYGQVSRTESGSITFATQNVYQATGLTGTLGLANGFALADGLGLRNVSGRTLIARIYASADVQAGNNAVLGLKLSRDTTLLDDSECRSHTGTGAANFAKLVTTVIVELVDQQQVTIALANFTGAGQGAVQRCRMVADVLEVA